MAMVLHTTLFVSRVMRKSKLLPSGTVPESSESTETVPEGSGFDFRMTRTTNEAVCSTIATLCLTVHFREQPELGGMDRDNINHECNQRTGVGY
eukprot:4020055-Pyramimonas_sp.AAC.1